VCNSVLHRSFSSHYSSSSSSVSDCNMQHNATVSDLVVSTAALLLLSRW
jgi:hypothetical protein